MTKGSTGPDRRRLFALADARRGVFTTAEALEAGFGRTTLHHAARNGEFHHFAQGLYRLANYPSSPEDRLVEIVAMLGPQAVVSHETALERYGVCDVAPKRIHVTLPRSKRFRSRRIPDVNIHTSDNPPANDEIVQDHGFRTTSLPRAIVDSARVGTDPKQILMAVAAGLQRGLLTERDLMRALEDAPQRVRQLVHPST